jgi:transcriptional regulator
MHPNPAFRKASDAEALAFARARGFGTLSINGPTGPLMAHVPLLLAEDASHGLVHLARSNAIALADLPAPAVFAVLGPDAYVSPDWYGAEDQVPTWNYVAVHLRGVLEPMPAEALRDMVDALSAAHESRLAPKTPWTSAKMSPGAMDRMLRMILPFRLVIEEVASTFKLGQNKTAEQRAGVVTALEALVGESPATAIARLMRDLPVR